MDQGSVSVSSTPHPQINVELSRLCKTGACIKTSKRCIKKLFRTSALSSDGLHPNFIWLAIKTGLQLVDQISLVLEFIGIEKCTFYCDSVSFQLKETTPLAKIRRKPHHFDRFLALLCMKTAKTCIKKLFRTSALSSDGLHPNFIWLAIKTGLQIVDQISLVLDFICIEKCMFYCDSVSFQLKETTPLAKIRRKPNHFDRFPVLLPPLPPKSMLGCRIGSVAAPRRTRDDAIQH